MTTIAGSPVWHSTITCVDVGARGNVAAFADPITQLKDCLNFLALARAEIVALSHALPLFESDTHATELHAWPAITIPADRVALFFAMVRGLSIPGSGCHTLNQLLTNNSTLDVYSTEMKATVVADNQDFVWFSKPIIGETPDAIVPAGSYTPSLVVNTDIAVTFNADGWCQFGMLLVTPEP